MKKTDSLGEILEAIRALSSRERAQLRALLDEMGTTLSEDAFAEHLAALGLLEKNRAHPPAQFPSFQPVAARGKPASEIIIESRR